MRYWSSKAFPIMLALMVFVAGAALWAQDGGEGERGDRPERGDRGQRGRQVDPEQMRQRMEERRAAMSERMRERLDVSQEEWSVLEPMLEQVQVLQRQGSGRGMMMMGRGGWAGRGGDDGPRGEGGEARELPPVPEATRVLNQTLEDEGASDADISEKLEALRQARAQHEQQLTEARNQLRDVVTPRQEAQLVVLGILD